MVLVGTASALSLAAAPRAPPPQMRAASWKPGETAPAYLDGSMPADAGCDPLCLVALGRPVGITTTPMGLETIPSMLSGPWSVAEREALFASRSPDERTLTLEWMREAEIKHARLAMLAVVGWPLAELFAGSFGALGFTGGRAPSLFNGGLDAYAVFMLAATAGTAYLELLTVDDVNQTWLNTAEGKAKYSPGATLQFDPLDIAGKAGSYDLRSAEIYNGRLASTRTWTPRSPSPPPPLSPSPPPSPRQCWLSPASLCKNSSGGSRSWSKRPSSSDARDERGAERIERVRETTTTTTTLYSLVYSLLTLALV